MKVLLKAGSYQNSQKRGFTLIEIMIGVAVIGVLATVAFPLYQNYISRTDVDRCIKMITPARMTADNLINLNNGVADAGLTANALGIAAGTSCDNIVIGGFNTVNNGDITISGTVRGNTMTWARDGSNGTWACASSDASLGPVSCP